LLSREVNTQQEASCLVDIKFKVRDELNTNQTDKRNEWLGLKAKYHTSLL